MEVGENRVCVFYGTEKREKEKDSRYIQEASAPAAEPCIRPVTCLRHKYTCNIGCCMSTLHRELQLRLQSQARLLALKQLVFRMRIASGERLISVQTDMQTDMIWTWMWIWI